MSVQALESAVAKLDEAELLEFGQWFDTFRDLKQFPEDHYPDEVEAAHQEEVLSRKAEYLADPSRAKVADAAYFAELRKRLAHARR